MKVTIILVGLLFIACIIVAVPFLADDESSQQKEDERVQSHVREIVSAVYKGDVDAVLRYTHPKIIDALGGRENLRAFLKQSLMVILAKGMKVEELEFPTNPIFVKGTENEFVIVTTKIIVSAGDKRLESLNYQFGARPVGSFDWKYIEGSRINQQNVRKLFPDFPKDYEFPATYRKPVN